MCACVFLFIFLRFEYDILNEYLYFIKIRKYNNLIIMFRVRVVVVRVCYNELLSKLGTQLDNYIKLMYLKFKKIKRSERNASKTFKKQL